MFFQLKSERYKAIKWDSVPMGMEPDLWTATDVVLYLGDNQFLCVAHNQRREVYNDLTYWEGYFLPYEE